MLKFDLYNKNSIEIAKLEENSIHSMVTDPPYGISYQNNDWDKVLPNNEIWQNAFKILKHGSFSLVFSSVRLMHRLMNDLEDSGFVIKDVLFWVYLNGMPKSRNVGLEIDKALGVESNKIGNYKYVQGYKKNGANSYKAGDGKSIFEPSSPEGKKYNGAGLALKPSYEPIILIQKPLEKGLNVAENILKHGTGALNIEETRIPYDKNESKVGHNPHPKGRVPSNILRTDDLLDGLDKFFSVPKVRQKKDDFNYHPTIKPLELMNHLVNLVSFKNQIIIDPFMGSGTTGVSCRELKRDFIGYETNSSYFDIAIKRVNDYDDLLTQEKIISVL